jgi:hypothetical protein
MVSSVSTPQCGQRIVASVTGSGMGGIYSRFAEAFSACMSLINGQGEEQNADATDRAGQEERHRR